jgi:hypothetical protein
MGMRTRADLRLDSMAGGEKWSPCTNVGRYQWTTVAIFNSTFADDNQTKVLESADDLFIQSS